MEGRSVALVTLVSGFIGAFNGFATYPVTIPGLVEIGFDGVQATTSYLVYFSWTLPFNSLFIAPNISNAASHVPVVDIVRVAGLLTIPLVFLSLLGFMKILGFRFFAWKTQALFWTTGLANVIAIILFTQVWPSYYILMMIAGAAISLAGLYVYGRIAKRRAARKSAGRRARAGHRIPRWDCSKPTRRCFWAWSSSSSREFAALAEWLDHFQFGVAAWGYNRISINIFTTAGFYIFVTAMVCYLFRRKKAHAAKDFVVASKRSGRSISTLCVGSATVYLMVDSGQIALLGKILAKGGTFVYSSLYPLVAFLGGMAFGQGLPGDFLFSRMQVSIAPTLGIPLMVLVGIITVVTMGPPNALKPTQIALHGFACERERARWRNISHLPAVGDAATCRHRDSFSYSCVLVEIAWEVFDGSMAMSGNAQPVQKPSLDFQTHLALLEAQGLLIRIDRPINKDTELHPLVRCQFLGGIPEEERRAFLFTNVVDSRGRRYDIPVVVGALAASPKIYAVGMGCAVEEIGAAWTRAIANPIAPVTREFPFLPGSSDSRR